MFFNCHNHTMYSNLRLLDCIIKPQDLIDRAIQLGLSGIAITDHEALSAHMEVNKYAKKIREKNPDFTIALGNEIYLTETREKGQPYYHFILIAKDAIGHRALRELSSKAWYNSYFDRGMERVPLLKSELAEIMKQYKGHVMATTACMGGELSKLLSKLHIIRESHLPFDDDEETVIKEIQNFINYCCGVFGPDDFYIECAPSSMKDQILINKYLAEVAQKFGLNLVAATDSHYLSKETRFAHKAYLNSKGGDREVDSFYEFARLMDEREVRELLAYSFDEITIDMIMHMTEDMRQKVQWYSLEKPQQIPLVEVPKRTMLGWAIPNTYPTLSKINREGSEQEQYWLDCCMNSLIEHGILEENTLNTYMERLEIEADIINFIGNRLGTCLFAYFNTFRHYIDLFWDCGSIVGPGRGSATGFLSNYLLGITQLDPIRWELPYWRFLNKERAELPDIDIDLAPSKRPEIFSRIREERGELGLIQVATFGTEGSKSAVLTACRGYRRFDEDGIEMYPDGIDVDIAQYITSLIPQERGFLWSIKEVIYGDKEKGRNPIPQFKRELDKYPGLLEIIFAIEGIVKQRGCHASGVIMYEKDKIYDTAAIMRTPSGDLITCYDLHMAEAAGDTKYDFLVTEVSDKIITCFDLMVKDRVVENIGLRALYNKYLHPEKIDTTNPVIWEHLAAGDILDVFQFNSGVGLAVAKKVKPQNPLEMTAANAMMRLMSEKGKESQQDRFARIKSIGIKAFDNEMKEARLPESMIKAMHKYCDTYYGCCAIQEQMMQILMDQDIAGFSLADANDARKIVAKKQMSRIPELKKKVYDVMDIKLADYIWEVAVAPQLGYAFSLNHSLPYSFVGIQTILLATQFSPIYWNTACLIVNSGAVDPELSGTTDYGKIAKALGAIQSNGIKIGLPDINKAGFGFVPDAEGNQILFGLKGLLNVGDDVVESILENRPYDNFTDFINKVNPNKQAVVSLIKSGAFDNMQNRKNLMLEYLWRSCDKKKRITLQNMNGLIQKGLLPDSLALEGKTFEFNRYLKNVCKTDGDYYVLDDRAYHFIDVFYSDIPLEVYNAGYALNQKLWDRVYQQKMDIVRNWMREHQEETLYQLNKEIFKADWEKYNGQGSLSAWEMEVMCFYYHEHELKDINRIRYGLSNFYDLPENPIVEKTFVRSGVEIPIYRLNRICGTCIAKNKNKGTVSLLTPEGVVTVKFRNEYFAMFDKQISERGADGVKHVVEKSWFNRGSMIVVMGIRRGDEFVPKKYASTPGHQLYKIDKLNENGTIVLRHDRVKGEESDE